MSLIFEKTTAIEIAQELYKRKFQIIIITFVVSLFIAIFSLFIDNSYKASANILPNPNRGLGFDVFAENGGIQNLASSFLGQKSDETNRFYIILDSYSTGKSIVDQFNLIDYYETTDSDFPLDDAIDILRSNLNYEAKEEGNFIIEFEDKDPSQAKEIVDFIIDILNQKNNSIASKEATTYREFIESRYNNALNDLAVASNDFSTFQEKHGVLELPKQIEYYFSIIAQLTSEKYASEIELDLISQTMSTKSSSYQSAQAKLNSIQNRLDAVYSDSLNNNIELDFKSLPKLAADYLKLAQLVEVQVQIQKFLVPLYEQAKMDEAKSLPIVSVIDSARIPVKKNKPRRSLIVIFAGFSTFILLILYIILRLGVKKNYHIISEITS